MRARKIQKTIQTYLFSIGTIYLFAFVSLFVQIPGLYGNNGILPVKNVIPDLEGNLSLTEHVNALKEFPSLLMYYDCFGLSPHYMMELVCLVGALVSIGTMVFTAMRCSLMFLVLWILYLSVHKAGQTFLHFQWDSLLLETGIITVLVAPLNVQFWKRPIPRPHDVPSLWLVRWLLFRLMFASGIVKLTSGCPTWWNLTALDWHYESQCIPTPLAWYAHQLPDWIQKLSVIGTYYIEILVPFLFFLPIRSLRLFSFWSQVFFQICIILTGNYNFFNLLTIALCISLLDDEYLVSKKKKKVVLDWTRSLANSLLGKKYGGITHGVFRFITFMSVVTGLGAICWYYFGIKIRGSRIFFKTRFDYNELAFVLSYAVPFTAVMGGVSLMIELLISIWDSLGMPGILNKTWTLLQTIIMGIAIVGMFSISLISHGVLDRSFNSELPSELLNLHNAFKPYEFTNPYGLFRRMTGVGGRPELIIEGTNNIDHGPWKEYNFIYKPGHIDAPPPFVFPHQPRLDWQMWFAALGHHEHNPWLVHLVYKLLKGQHEVLELLAPPPFTKPPRYIRVQLYTYHYTSYDVTRPFYNQSFSAWWSREYGKEYMFSLTVEHKGLLDFLKRAGFSSDTNKDKLSNNYISLFVDQMRKYSRLLLPHELLWSLFTAIIFLIVTKNSILSQAQEAKQKERKITHKATDPSSSSSITTPQPPSNDNDNSVGGKTQKRKKSAATKKRNATKNDENN